MKISKLIFSVMMGLIVNVAFSGLARAGSVVINEPTLGEIENALTGASTDPLDSPAEKAVIGPENRQRFSNNALPWRAMGRIKFGKNARWGCSATLVGPRHIITNAHCVDVGYPIFFYPSYNNGDYLNLPPKTTWAVSAYSGTATSSTASGVPVLGPGFNQTLDYSILTLNERVGDKFGWIGTKTFDLSWVGGAYWRLFSYPNAGELNQNGEYPLLENGCAVRESDNGYLLHDCDTNGGASGAAMWAMWGSQPALIGLTNMEWGGPSCATFQRYKCNNGAVSQAKFIDVLKKILIDQP